jgi:nucleotide-binding universal stress UspA family protein
MSLFMASQAKKGVAMYKHIMLPVDGSELSLKAVDEGLKLSKSTGARVTFLNVVPHFSLNVSAGLASDAVKKLEKSREDEYKKAGVKIIAQLDAQAKADGIESDGVVSVGDYPYEEIISNAEEKGCDLIMMASHGRRGLDAVLMGSETAKVLTHTKIPVLVVR